ncbi:MAG: oligoendopeptidase F [Clostridiales bacterium]|nr:oligoendopeptidase F [Clostridiales bacterium]
MERQEVASNLKWKVEDIFPSDEAWEKEFQEIAEKYGNYDFSVFKGKLGDKQTLLDCFRLLDTISRKIEVVYLYAHLRHDEDLRLAKYTSSYAQVAGMISKIFAEFAFVEPELTALDSAVLDSFIADPDFAEYDYKLRKIASAKAHVLSEAEEKILALGSDVMRDFQSVFGMINNANLNLPTATLQGEEVQMSHGLYGVALRDRDSAVRKEWFEKYYSSFIKMIDTLAQTYYSNVKKNVFYKTVRHYDSCIAMAMDGEDVSPAVYDNLIKAVHGALPIVHEYVALRKEVLGLDEQHMYDMYLPLVENADIKLPFEEAYQLVIEGLAPLGEGYQNLLRKARTEGWMDVCETEGKRSGAYSSGVYDTHPYVLLNYQQTTNDIFTVAHEMGHALHSYKSQETQPYAKADYTIFLAEIASTVNEVLLLKHLYKNTEDKNLKKYLLNYYMDTIRATLFRQTQFAEFEQIAHAKAEAGEALTKENLCEVYYQLNKDYYGEGVAHDKEIAYEWARIPHFYNAFYVYKYATGIISAISIVKRILTKGQPAVDDYFRFLSSGGCTDPVSILKQAGVDLTTDAPFQAAMEEFKNTLEEFKSLL